MSHCVSQLWSTSSNSTKGSRGSVCVTVDDDEHSAFARPTENAVLKRGDHFGVCTVYLHAL